MSSASLRPASLAASPVTYLAFDFGTRRIGVAVGNTLRREAQPLRTLQHMGTPPWLAIEAVIHEWQAAALIVGIPLYPDGAEHELTLKARRFARQLQGRFHLPVQGVDERYSSVEAASLGAQGLALDAGAAAIILNQFFAEQAHHESTAT